MKTQKRRNTESKRESDSPTKLVAPAENGGLRRRIPHQVAEGISQPFHVHQKTYRPTTNRVVL